MPPKSINREPVMHAANFSSRSSALVIRNRRSTTIAEISSIALSPPNASSTALPAIQAESNDPAASITIHAIVTICIR
jgi:hypothetical protein